MKLDFKVGIVSLVGINGTFPRGHGNYFTVNYEGSEAIVINMSHEDFCDAKSKGMTSGGIECKIFGYNGSYAIYVTDTRIPEKARSCWHTYGMSGVHVANVVRSVYNIDDYDCIMKTHPELASKISRSTSYNYDTPGFRIRTITCGCCNKPHTLEPEVYERTNLELTYKIRTNHDSGIFYAPEIVDDSTH